MLDHQGSPNLGFKFSFRSGTSVWHVRIATRTTQPGHEMKRAVPKVAWRAQAREPELNIYAQIKAYGGHPRVAEFLDGGDVIYFSVPGQLTIPLGIQELRNPRFLNQPPISSKIIMSSTGSRSSQLDAGYELSNPRGNWCRAFFRHWLVISFFTKNFFALLMILCRTQVVRT
jgi:hypothetical protein